MVSESKQQELQPLPCPFCGMNVLPREGFHLTCVRCGAAGPDADDATDEAIVAAWNRRAASALGGETPDAVLTDEQILDAARSLKWEVEQEDIAADAVALVRAAMSMAPAAEHEHRSGEAKHG